MHPDMNALKNTAINSHQTSLTPVPQMYGDPTLMLHLQSEICNCNNSLSLSLSRERERQLLWEYDLLVLSLSLALSFYDKWRATLYDIILWARAFVA